MDQGTFAAGLRPMLETAVMTSVHGDSIVQLQMKAITAVTILSPCPLVITAVSSLRQMDFFMSPFLLDKHI